MNSEQDPEALLGVVEREKKGCWYYFFCLCWCWKIILYLDNIQ